MNATTTVSCLSEVPFVGVDSTRACCAQRLPASRGSVGETTVQKVTWTSSSFGQEALKRKIRSFLDRESRIRRYVPLIDAPARYHSIVLDYLRCLCSVAQCLTEGWLTDQFLVQICLLKYSVDGMGAVIKFGRG